MYYYVKNWSCLLCTAICVGQRLDLFGLQVASPWIKLSYKVTATVCFRRIDTGDIAEHSVGLYMIFPLSNYVSYLYVYYFVSV